MPMQLLNTVLNVLNEEKSLDEEMRDADALHSFRVFENGEWKRREHKFSKIIGNIQAGAKVFEDTWNNNKADMSDIDSVHVVAVTVERL